MINLETRDKVTILTINTERMNAGIAQELKDKALSLPATANIVLDFSKVSLVDSGGLGGLVSLLKATAAKNSNLLIFGLQKPVRVMFELTRMHKLFDIYNDLDECISILHG